MIADGEVYYAFLLYVAYRRRYFPHASIPKLAHVCNSLLADRNLTRELIKECSKCDF